MCVKGIRLTAVCFILVCLMCISSVSADIDRETIMGLWLFEQPGVVTDSGPYGYHGTTAGGPGFAEGPFGNAVFLDGVDDTVTIDSPTEILAINDVITVTFWLQYSNPEGWPFLVRKDRVGGIGWSCDSHASRGLRLRMDTSGGTNQVSWMTDGDTAFQDGEWHHVAWVINQGEVTGYLEGERIGGGTYPHGDGFASTQGNLTIGPMGGSSAVTAFDDIGIFIAALGDDDIMAIYTNGLLGAIGSEGATNPTPANGAKDVSRDVILSWTPLKFTAQRRVYLGTAFSEVDEAGVDDALSVQDASTYDAGVLDFGQTYYWRIDEVNGAPDNTVFKGEVWNFTVEPTAFPIENIIATASGGNPDMEPSKTVDGSGLNELDEHSTISTDMWLTFTNGSWIQYEFDRAYKLHELWVWNSNQNIESFFGFGIKEAAIEASVDGEVWTEVAGVAPFAQAPGQATYQANTTVDLSGVTARYVRISPQNAHGLLGQSGLSEVRFWAIPTDPRELVPTDGSTTSDIEVTLTWRAGREAAAHEVYLGTDPANLALLVAADETAVVAGDLDYAQTYYWQIVEVNETETPARYASEIQRFDTPAYGIVDDFESYSGQEGQEVFMTWLDGYGGDASLGGSTTGHIDGPFVETSNTNPGTAGSQSMPVTIDNDGGFFDIDGKSSSPTFSEVVRDVDPAQDWTTSGVKTLSIMFSGSTGLTGQLYCRIGNTKLLYNGDASNLGLSVWQAWNIDLSTVGGNLASVREFAIGVEGGSSGILYIDDIRLYTRVGEMTTPVLPDTANLVAYYPLDGDYQDASGNNRHGTPVAPGENPIFEPGMTGQALGLNVVGQYVEITGYQGIVADRSDPNNPIQHPFTVACWVNTTTAGGSLVTWGSSDGGPVGGQYQGFRINGGSLRAEHGAGNYRGATPVDDGEWHHVALSVAEGANLQIPQNQLFVDGQADSFRAGGSDNIYNITADADVSIGQRASHGDRFFTGSIDDVRIYDRALSAAEIAGLAGRKGLIHKPF